MTLQLPSPDWTAIADALEEDGFASTPPLLSTLECDELLALYDDPHTRFRSVIDMARYNFGSGQYKYFDYPLPAAVQTLRESLYPKLAVIANDWARKLRQEVLWPDSHDAMLRLCRAEGQTRPTPLMLRYRQDDYNCLHQDLYGSIHFPLQVIFMLSSPGRDFTGGELILVEQRPRMQSRPVVVPQRRGGAAIIPVRERPRQGRRGFHRAQMRHGVSRITNGTRTTLGLIFHDAA